MDNTQLKKKANKKFGNLLFGHNPHMSAIQSSGKYERNTPYEHKMYVLLTKFIAEGDVDVKELAKYLRDLKQYKNIYPKILKNIRSPLYRGTEVSDELVKKILPKLKYERLGESDDEYNFCCNIIYKPRSAVQHWSVDVNATLAFAEGAIFKTKNDDSFIFNPKSTGAFADGTYEEEQEVIRIGNRIECKLYISENLIENYMSFNELKPEVEKHLLNIFKKIKGK